MQQQQQLFFVPPPPPPPPAAAPPADPPWFEEVAPRANGGLQTQDGNPARHPSGVEMSLGFSGAEPAPDAITFGDLSDAAGDHPGAHPGAGHAAERPAGLKGLPPRFPGPPAAAARQRSAPEPPLRGAGEPAPSGSNPNPAPGPGAGAGPGPATDLLGAPLAGPGLGLGGTQGLAAGGPLRQASAPASTGDGSGPGTSSRSSPSPFASEPPVRRPACLACEAHARDG